MRGKRFAQALGVSVLLGAGIGAAPVIAHDRDKPKECDKCHQVTTVTVTETEPGGTVTVVQTVPGPERERTVTDTVTLPAETVTLPAVTVVETQPAETFTETVVQKSEPRVVTKVKWRTKVKWKTRTVTKLKRVCKPPPPRPCCEGAG